MTTTRSATILVVLGLLVGTAHAQPTTPPSPIAVGVPFITGTTTVTVIALNVSSPDADFWVAGPGVALEITDTTAFHGAAVWVLLQIADGTSAWYRQAWNLTNAVPNVYIHTAQPVVAVWNVFLVMSNNGAIFADPHGSNNPMVEGQAYSTIPEPVVYTAQFTLTPGPRRTDRVSTLVAVAAGPIYPTTTAIAMFIVCEDDAGQQSTWWTLAYPNGATSTITVGIPMRVMKVYQIGVVGGKVVEFTSTTTSGATR